MRRIFFVLLMVAALPVLGGNYVTQRDVSYCPQGETDAYRLQRCKLDVYYPADSRGFATVVWLHGGALEGGGKHIPAELAEKNMAVVAVNYRLSPRATCPAYLDDVAQAVAWVFTHIESFGGRRDRIFVSGHSAGGYLALMLALKTSLLDGVGVAADSVAAWLPISGQTATHYTIRKERGLRDGVPIMDEFAPTSCARAVTPPIVLITGDRHLEMVGRYEENALLEAVLRGLGNQRVSLYELQGFNHGSVLAPACLMVADYVREACK